MEVKEQKLYDGFQSIAKDSAEIFAPFRGKDLFGDTTFTLFYAWQDRFHYSYQLLENTLVVLEHGIDSRIACILLREDGGNIDRVVSALYRLFREIDLPLYFEYVREDDLPLYTQAALLVGQELEIRSIFDDNDYIYQTDEFLALSGGRNKGKRGALNALLREFPDIRMVSHDGAAHDLRRDCAGIFDEWCAAHRCEDCVYGCEKRAFQRFWEIFDPRYHRVSVGYAGGKPVSFAVSEEVNPEMDCYYFQKNAVRIRGLTYWLNREMALEHAHVKYINLGEDMGLPGLRTDKAGLHPCKFGAKFTVKIR